MERCRKPWSFESKRTKPTVIVQHLIQSMGDSILKHQIPWKYELDIPKTREPCSILHKSVELRTRKKWLCQKHGAFVLTCSACGDRKRFLRNFWLFKTKAPRLWSTEAAWEPFGHQTVEELKMSLQRPSGSHSATRAHNSSE